MNRTALLLCMLVSGLSAWGEDSSPQLTTSAGWSFSTSDAKGSDAPWTTDETAFAGITARWGSHLELAGSLRSDFTGASLTADNVLEELALTWTANAFTIVTVGKQRLSWGTARVFSSIDSLEPPLDPVDPKAKPRGVTGMKAEIIPLDWLSVWLLAMPAQRLDDTVLSTRFDVLLEDADLSFGAVRSITSPVISYSGTALQRERRETPAFFADFARFFDRFGLYGEAQLRQGRNREWFLTPGVGAAPYTLNALGASQTWSLKATSGLQVEFPVWLNGNLRWLTEYHYNGEGLTEAEASDFEKVWPLRAQPSPSVFLPPAGLWPGAYRRHYLYSGLSGLPLTEKISVSASVLAGIDGGLLLINSSLAWDVGQSLNVSLGYERFDCWNGSPDRSELLFLSYRNRVNLSVNAWY